MAYILVAIDYVSKWEKDATCRNNDLQMVIKFLKGHILSIFGAPKDITRDGVLISVTKSSRI